VDLFCLEKREEMPAHPWEIALAEEEGVFINNSWAPKRVLGDERVTGLGLMKCVSVLDKACNFNPVYDEDITHKAQADSIILAVGQTAVLDFIAREKNITIQGSRLSVGDDLSTGEEGVFAGGDVVTGPASIIGAIAQGRKAAEAMDLYLGGSGDISETLAEPEDEVVLSELVVQVEPRNELPHLKVWERANNFDQVEKPLTDSQIAAETNRCLNCDARRFEVSVNVESCKECGYCAEVCGVDTFAPAAGFNVKGYRPMVCKSSDWCVGCFKCFFSCPDFAIDVREVRS
jgi:NAD-dependent dihydropyrimidine dehydrogenase PreA subunit